MPATQKDTRPDCFPEILATTLTLKLAECDGVPVLVLPGGINAVGPHDKIDPFILVLDWALKAPDADLELARDFLERDSRWWSLPPMTREEFLR